MIEDDLNTYLRGHTLTSTLVGLNVFPLKVPDDVSYPAITYQIISRPNVHSLEGASGLEFILLQIGCYARRFRQSKLIRNAVVSAIDGYRGMMGATMMQGILKQPGERDIEETVPGNRALTVYGVQIDFRVMANEPFPELG